MRLKDDERRVMAGMRRGLSFSDAAKSLDPQRRYIVARRWKIEGWYAIDSHDLYAGRLTQAGLGIKLPPELLTVIEAESKLEVESEATSEAEAKAEDSIGETKDEGDGEPKSSRERDIASDVECVQGQEQPDVDR